MTMSKPMMKCGHAANATREDGSHCCAICSPDDKAYILAHTPDLTGRQARCSCMRLTPSSTDLAFFEYRGPGSRIAVETCKCNYHRVAHQRDPKRVDPSSVVELGKCSGFVANGGHEYDSYYCGHAGWD